MSIDCPKCKHELAPGQKFCDNCGEQNTDALKVRTKEEIKVMKERLLSLADKYPGAKGIAAVMVVFPQISLLEWVLGDDRDPIAPISNALERFKGV